MKRYRTLLHQAVLIAFALAILLTLIAFRGSAQSENPNPSKDARIYAPLAKVPERARSRRNPFENDPHASAAGGQLFEQHCSECHGKKGEGGHKGASLLRPEVTQAQPGALFWILSNGVIWHGMPDWSKLPEPQRWQLIAFMKTLKPSMGDQPAGTSH